MTEAEQFETLFRTYYGKILAYAGRRTEASRAHDVVAETFIAAWRHLDSLPDDPLPWLYRVARNCLANDARQARRQHRLALLLIRRRPEVSPDPAVGVVEDLRLRSALAKLTSRDREALLLIGWEQLDHATAAQVMRCSSTAFAVRLHRARRRLALLLAEADTEVGVSADAPPNDLGSFINASVAHPPRES